MSEPTTPTTQNPAIRNLLFRMADDELVMGHRTSEWTGLGPILEEDISFSSISQDQIGHALALYTILNQQFGEATPDALAFGHDEADFHSCHFVELPGIGANAFGGYDFALVRHFLFDHAEMTRYESLVESSFQPLAGLAKKIKGELKYHILHADLWMDRLGKGTEESHARMQSALNLAMPYALGMFEPTSFDADLVEQGVTKAEAELRTRWLDRIRPIVQRSTLTMPDVDSLEPVYGGRRAYHSEYLQPLINEMSEVYRLDPTAVW